MGRNVRPATWGWGLELNSYLYFPLLSTLVGVATRQSCSDAQSPKDAQPHLPLCHKPRWNGPRQKKVKVCNLKPRQTLLVPRCQQSLWLPPLWHPHPSLLYKVGDTLTLPCILRYLDNGSIYYLEGDLDFWGYCQPGCGEQVINSCRPKISSPKI